jgi:hypothetical protein
LKPGKPVPDGKRVKCPKCGNMFTTPGLVADEEPRPRKPSAAKKQKAAVKKAAAAPKPPPKKPAPEDDDEEDQGGIYAYVKEEGEGGGEDAEEEEDGKPQIDYAPDMSIKDLRGPAQAAVVKPSNYLLLIGGLCCIFDILIICVSFWEMVFSEYLINHENFLADYYKQERPKKTDEVESNPMHSQPAAPTQQSGKKIIPEKRSDLDKKDLALVEEAETWAFAWPYFGRVYRFIAIGVFILLFIYNAITILGAVKMQNLESRGWGIAASIMTMLPFGSTSLANVVSFLFYLLFAMLLDDEAMGWTYASGGGALVWILAIVAGVYALRTLLTQEVIDGFNYVAE